ncbi:MAG: PEGA domain-containing protein [Bacteroidetes bacterium]|jgi:uncharacterized protein YceK|nr:PEGA domain-containing protein [Bacteroidota bacterium]
MRSTVLLVSALLLLSGCATLFSGTEDDITFDSEPQGAQVLIDGIVVGTTPTTVVVDRPGLEETDVTVQLDGYDPLRFELDTEFNNTAILNVFFWPGFVVDVLTGALFKYDKKSYTADLEDGTVTMRLDALPRGPEGQYLLPDHDAPIAVTNHATGLTLLFK